MVCFLGQEFIRVFLQKVLYGLWKKSKKSGFPNDTARFCFVFCAYKAYPYGRSKLCSKLTPQLSFEKISVLAGSKLSSKLNLFFSTLNSTLSSKLVVVRVNSVALPSQTLHSDNDDTDKKMTPTDTQTTPTTTRRNSRQQCYASPTTTKILLPQALQ
jgi:hypothetical protein